MSTALSILFWATVFVWGFGCFMSVVMGLTWLNDAEHHFDSADKEFQSGALRTKWIREGREDAAKGVRRLRRTFIWPADAATYLLYLTREVATR